MTMFCVFPALVRIVCRCPDKSTEQKTFLLDDGRLKLNVLKEAFGLTSVELLIG